MEDSSTDVKYASVKCNHVKGAVDNKLSSAEKVDNLLVYELPTLKSGLFIVSVLTRW